MVTCRGSSYCSYTRWCDCRKPPGPSIHPCCLLVCINALLQLLINAGLEGGRQASDNFNDPENGDMNLQPPSLVGVARPTYISSTTLNRPHPPSSTPSFRTQPNQYTNHSFQASRVNGTGDAHYRGTEDSGDESDGTTRQDAREFRGGNEYNGQTGGNRTLFFTRLPEKATYASFLEVVRGGAVVDAWMKPSDRCASVSFLQPQSAEAFYRYAKKNDLYIDGRRVGHPGLSFTIRMLTNPRQINVEWREPSRQFVVLPNILRQIHAGATRNLYLKNIPPTLTEERLRNDLDHIANLSVEKIILEKSKNAVQVNLNSVCVACFARTCLKSRAYYKGTKIDFGADDCAKSLPDLKAYNPKQEAKPKPERKISNRFDALAIDVREGCGDLFDDDTDGTGSWADCTADGTGYTNG